MEFSLKLMIFIQDVEIKFLRSLTLLTSVFNPPFLFLVLISKFPCMNSANIVTAEYGKQWVLGPERVLAVLNKAFTNFTRLHFIKINSYNIYTL
jgi:hypothetical protein